jgi:mono/diheme cytochrome c family protein
MQVIRLAIATTLSLAALNLSAAPVDLSKLPPPSTQQGVTYEKDIKPIFDASCIRCHGNERPKAQLRLDSKEGALRGSKEGKVITPGNSEKSKLVIAVARLDEETAMPPKPRQGRGGRGPGGAPGQGGPGAGGPGNTAGAGATHGTNQPFGRGPMGPPPKPLTSEQVSLIRAWIDQGAH